MILARGDPVTAMRRAFNFYRTSVGKKVVMALTGVVLFGFVVAHMVGNLKIFLGRESFDAYAGWLREIGHPALARGQVLWMVRAVLIAAVVAHVVAAWQLSRMSWRARSTGSARGVRSQELAFSYASSTMRWGGLVIAAFVVYHVLHLTLGTTHPDFDHGSAYRNVVVGFRSWPVALAYSLAMIPLGAHLYHGLWSTTQTLAVTNEHVRRWRRPLAAGIALVIVAGNVAIPALVLARVIPLDPPEAGSLPAAVSMSDPRPEMPAGGGR